MCPAIAKNPTPEYQEMFKDLGYNRTIIRDSLQYGFRNPNDIRMFLNYGMTNVKVSTKVNCGKNHCSQLKFLTDILMGWVQDFLIWACRGGSKTYFLGLISWLFCGMNEGIENKLLGGSQAQSEKAYKAMDDFWLHSKLSKEYLVDEPMKTRTDWKNGSNTEILTASTKSVRGPHPQILLLDEIDEMDEQIYDSALSQPQSKNNFKAMTGIASTNHRQIGTMGKAIQSANEGAFKLYKYCVWEVLESCKDYNCSTCKLSSLCPGKQMKNADGYYKIDDFIGKLSKLSMYVLKLDWLCDTPGSKDAVYAEEWDPDIHIVDIDFNEKYDVWLSFDWGGADPFVIGAWQRFPEKGWVKIDEIYETNTTNKRMAILAMSRPWWNNVRGGFPDPSRNDLKREWKKDYKVDMLDVDNSIDEGIEAVKNCLKPIIGYPIIYFNKKCVNTINEFGLYINKNGKPVDENNHCMDETRYFVKNKIARKIKSKKVGGGIV